MDFYSIFRNKKINFEKAEADGFVRDGGTLIKNIYIADGALELKLYVDDNGIKFNAYDRDTGDEYTLHLVDGAEGEFVGKVRSDIERELKCIAEACCDDVVFRFSQTAAIIAYAKQKYGDDPEFPWNDENAILRRSDSGKWYAAILHTKGDKFGHGTDGDEVIDMRADPEETDRIVDDINYFRGYHMNKKHWLTVVLDGSVTTKEICERLDKSYALAKK